MKFRSNTTVSITLSDLKKAEAFYSGVMGFRLTLRSPTHLEYDTGRVTLCVHEGAPPHAPAPTFNVISATAAKAYLVEHGCEVVQEREHSLLVRDPLGVVFTVVED